MRKLPIAIAAICLVVSASVPAFALGPVVVATRPTAPAFAPSWSHNALDQDAPDPDVVRFGSTFYAYTTGTAWGNHIGILHSSFATRDYRTKQNLPYGSSAFPSIPYTQSIRPWQVNSTQHAPGVFKIRGRYVMYYTAQTVSGHGGHYCLSVATATSPAGPFADHSSGPWLCMDAKGGVIDPSPFVAPAGRPWLYFKTYDDINRGSAQSRIYVARLSPNGLTRAGPPIPVLDQSALSSSYETVENPQMLYIRGSYVLLNSRGDWGTSNYRQSFAVCSGPAGPCHEGKPKTILRSYGSLLGPGGGTSFTDTAGRRWLAFQAWKGTPGCVGYHGSSCARKLFVAVLHA